jgi:hypothetical protein
MAVHGMLCLSNFLSLTFVYLPNQYPRVFSFSRYHLIVYQNLMRGPSICIASCYISISDITNDDKQTLPFTSVAFRLVPRSNRDKNAFPLVASMKSITRLRHKSNRDVISINDNV